MPCTVFVSVGVVCSLRLEHVRCQHQAAGTVRHRTSTVLAGRQTDRQTYPLLLLLSQPTPVSALVCLCLHMPRTSLAACPFRTLWVLVLLRSALLCCCCCRENVEIDIRWKENISIFTSCSSCFFQLSLGAWHARVSHGQGSMHRKQFYWNPFVVN